MIATSEYRALSSHERSLRLIEKENCSQYEAAEACNLTQSAVARASKAKRAMRSIGQNGRPTVLSPSEKAELRQYALDKDDAGESATNFEIREKVAGCFEIIFTFSVCSLCLLDSGDSSEES